MANNPTEVDYTKFWIENFAANTSGRDAIYSNYDQSQLSNLQNEVKGAISLFNSTN